MPFRFLLCTMAIVLAAGRGRAAAGSGTLKGVVGVRPGSGRSAGPLVDAVVMVTGLAPPAASDAPHAVHAVMDQQRQQFRPRVLAVAVGTTVEFPNHDSVPHNVRSSSPPRFDLGTYGPGKTRSTTFDAPAVVRVGCKVHPRMAGVVVVHENPWVAVTDALGRYTIRDVPAGTYQIRFWHDGSTAREVAVSIPAGAVAPLDVQLEPASGDGDGTARRRSTLPGTGAVRRRQRVR